MATERNPGRTLATNVPCLDHDGIAWQEFVERLNPKVWEPRDCDMRFYPHNSKHRDGRHRCGEPGATATPAGNGAAPMRQGTALTTATNAASTR